MDSDPPQNGQDHEIKRHIKEYYSRLFQADHQSSALPIRTGRALAEFLDYPVTLLPFIPEAYWAKFLPCGNPFPLLHPRSGDRLLNLGCGAAVDSFLIQAQYGPAVEVVNLDVVHTILQQACFLDATDAHRTGRLRWVCGEGERLPLRAQSFDWVLMNGTLNLFPDKASLLGEIRRVLKPSGRLVGADLCAAAPLPDSFREEQDAWAWCMSGACTEDELLRLFEFSGFRQVSLAPEEEKDVLYRVRFSCRKER